MAQFTNQPSPRPATASQVKAIRAICARRKIDLEIEKLLCADRLRCDERLRCYRRSRLSLRQRKCDLLYCEGLLSHPKNPPFLVMTRLKNLTSRMDQETGRTSPAGGEKGAAGIVQGGMVALPIPNLPTGIMRGRFNPGDGQLYACGLFAWSGNRQVPGGFYRVRRTEQALTIPTGLHAEPGSLSLEFPVPLAAASTDPARWLVRAWDLKRTKNYGSPKINERDLAVKTAELSSDGRRVTLAVPDFGPTWCYAVQWAVETADGRTLKGTLNGTLH